MVPAMSSSNLSCAQDEKVKLRVSYGGAFIMVSATAVHCDALRRQAMSIIAEKRR